MRQFSTVKLQCECGTLQGDLTINPKASFHVHCLCCDCQRFAKQLDNEDKILDADGGSDLFQTYPAYLRFFQGQENIRCMKLTPKGIYRWHTACCNMPIANTMTSASVPFVGVSVKLMQFESTQAREAAIGPVQLRAFGRYGKNGVPADAHERFPLSYMPKIIGFMLKGFITGKATPSPLFNAKAPVCEPTLCPRDAS